MHLVRMYFQCLVKIYSGKDTSKKFKKRERTNLPKMARKVTKKWEVFAGKNKFYCDGYLMTAPKTTVFYLTVFLITGTSGLFFAFE